MSDIRVTRCDVPGCTKEWRRGTTPPEKWAHVSIPRIERIDTPGSDKAVFLHVRAADLCADHARPLLDLLRGVATPTWNP